MLHCEHSNLAE
jgi:ABC-type arginine transport system permease subunit